jgi:hypothetical protein
MRRVYVGERSREVLSGSRQNSEIRERGIEVRLWKGNRRLKHETDSGQTCWGRG